MIYVTDVSTPANTPQGTPLRTELPVTSGLVYRVEFQFPPGSSGLLGCRVFDGSYQVWPASFGVYFRGDNVALAYDELYEKNAEPWVFVVETYNLDDTYAHEMQARICIVSKEEYKARFLGGVSLKDMEGLLSAVTVEQDASKTAAIEEFTSRFRKVDA